MCAAGFPRASPDSMRGVGTSQSVLRSRLTPPTVAQSGSRDVLRRPTDPRLASHSCCAAPERISSFSSATARSPFCTSACRLVPSGPGPGRHAGRSRDLHLVVRVVAARDRTLDEPVLHACDVRPEGMNLAWTTSTARARARLRAVHGLFGPAVSYNVAALLLPALAAWTCFLLCRDPDRVGLGLARRRLPLRLLELHPRPPARGAPAPDRHLPRPPGRPRPRPLPEGELDGRGSRGASAC